MRIEDPVVIATHDFTWHKEDGTHYPIQVMIGAPYRSRFDWACPCAVYGLDERYPDIVGISAVQALSLSLRLVRTRLVWKVETGAILDLADDGTCIDKEFLISLFGAA
jgi:hypothetical protein